MRPVDQYRGGLTLRILAIGDIHGCSRALDALLAVVQPTPNDLLITLGDYVDRGSDSMGILERLLEMDRTLRLVPLRGNHEEMMLQGRTGVDRRMWLRSGGDATLESYGCTRPYDSDIDPVPAQHYEFMEQRCRTWYETERHFFVHASVLPDFPLSEQPESMLLWERLDGPVKHISGKTMICGHTRQTSGLPWNLGTTICIDTGAYSRLGWLTCLEVQTGQVWQANELRKVRVFHLEDEMAAADEED
jgi:serine/threonine protein phosphatase 1